MKKFIIIIGVVIFSALVVGAIYYFYFFGKSSPSVQNQPEIPITHPSCLEDNEATIFQYQGPRVSATSADVIIQDKITKEEVFRFKIDNLSPNIGHPYEFHKCGIYVIKEFNWDHRHSKPLPGFSEELWKYTYDGKGEKILVFADSSHINYDLDFRVDPMEIYIALVKGRSWEPEEYGYVIKNQQTYEDFFSLLYPTILKTNPDLEGYLGLEGWTKDGTYFWGDVSAGAPRLGFVRIKRDSWNVNALSAPKDVLGGDALNLENGYITVHPDNVWFGIAEFTEKEKEKRRRNSIGTDLYIHNLISSDRHFIASTTEPLWYFKPKWLSDTELQYEMPTGEKKIYKIQ